ncbi:MAG: response regulator [Thermosynechococcus sp.]|uniref:response regulator n=1 Tax=Thermosynechococcus sp. TaxID=2814275 RepID=UPI00391A6548
MTTDLFDSGAGRILIVDDTPENVEVLTTLLQLEGYDVRGAISGQMALMGIEAEPPDVILLDIMMPDMDGYEVCQTLKENPKTKHIPIIFISALDDVFDKVKAFEIGAADYITKPFQQAEVLARVKNQLTIALLQRKLRQKNALLQKQNQQLQEIAEERRELVSSLQAAQEQYRQMFEEAVVGIYQSSPEGIYFKVNNALARIYGYADAEDWLADIEHHNHRPYVDDSSWQKFQQQIQSRGFVRNLVSKVYRADQTITTICECARPVKSEDGQLLYYEGFVFELPTRNP